MRKILLPILLIISLQSFAQREETITYGDSVYRMRYTTNYALDSAIRYNYTYSPDSLLVNGSMTYFTRKDSTPYLFHFRRILSVTKDSVLVPTKLKTVGGNQVVGTGDIPISVNNMSWGSMTGSIANQTDLQTALDGKQVSGSYAASSHTHAYNTLTGLPTLFTQANADALYATINHNHTGVYQPVGSYLVAADIAGKMDKSDSATYQTKYRSDSARTNIYNAINGKQASGNYATGGGTATGTNTGDNAVNTTYANDFRAANFVAGTNYLAPNGSAASLTNFPTLNQNTTGTASNVTGVVAFANGGISGAAAAPATTGTMTINMTSSVITITPTGACTFNASGGVAGQIVTFLITTSGTTSFTLTFGTNFRKTGTLATGTTSARFFTVTFRCLDGTIWTEISRTAAQT